MDNDVIGEMNREEGIGAALDVDDDKLAEVAEVLNDEDVDEH